MENKKTMNARRGTMLATALVLVVALLASLFTVLLGSAAGNEEKPKYDYTVTFDANGGTLPATDELGKLEDSNKDGKINENDTVASVKRVGYSTIYQLDKDGKEKLDENGNKLVRTDLAENAHPGKDGLGGLLNYSNLIPERKGYEFVGWSALADSSKDNVEPDRYNPKQDVTVKAVWYKLIDVAFDDMKGNDDSVRHIYLDKGESLNVKEIPQPTPKNGQVFSGWYKDKDCKEELENYAIMKPTEDITFYAGYSEGATVTLIANGGHFANVVNKVTEYVYSTSLPVYYEKGKKLSDNKYFREPDVKFEGRDFIAYYTDKNFSPDSRVDTDTVVTKDMTLYAKWDDGNFFFVNYKVYNEANGVWADYDALKRVEVGEALTRKQQVATPANSYDKDGKQHEFVGWYLDKELTEPAPKFDGSYVPTDDITLYAKFDNVIDVYLVYWYSNDNDEPTKIDSEPIHLTYVKGSASKSRQAIDSAWTRRMLSDEELIALGFEDNEFVEDENGNVSPAYPDDDIKVKGISTTWYTDRAHTKIFSSTEDLKGTVNIYGAAVKRQPLTLKTNDKTGYILPVKEGEKAGKEKTIYVNVDATLKEVSDPYFVSKIDQSKGNKAFYGWSLTEGSMKAVDEELVNKNKELYAIIGDAYTLTLDLNGGYTTGYKASEDNVRESVFVVDSIPMGTPVANYIDDLVFHYYGDKNFQGWSLDKAGKNMINPEEFTITENTTLYAQWARYGEEVDPEPEPQPEPETKLNGLVQGPDGKWAMYKDGEVDTGATGIFQNQYGWWRVENGYVNFNAQGIYQNQYGWWKTTDGKVTFKETGVFQNEFGWWRVEDSKVNFNAQGIYQNQYGWWKTTDGKVTFKEDGVFQNEYGWWKTKDSKVDFSFTGIASNKYGNWYIKTGKVDFNKNGNVQYNGKTYSVKNGKATLVK